MPIIRPTLQPQLLSRGVQNGAFQKFCQNGDIVVHIRRPGGLSGGGSDSEKESVYHWVYSGWGKGRRQPQLNGDNQYHDNNPDDNCYYPLRVNCDCACYEDWGYNHHNQGDHYNHQGSEDYHQYHDNHSNYADNYYEEAHDYCKEVYNYYQETDDEHRETGDYNEAAQSNHHSIEDNQGDDNRVNDKEEYHLLLHYYYADFNSRYVIHDDDNVNYHHCSYRIGFSNDDKFGQYHQDFLRRDG